MDDQKMSGLAEQLWREGCPVGVAAIDSAHTLGITRLRLDLFESTERRLEARLPVCERPAEALLKQGRIQR